MSRVDNEQPEIRPRRFLTTELSDEEAERIAASRMDKRHTHLDALLDEKREASATPSPGNLSGGTLTAAMPVREVFL
jgi:hypothetical protein